MVEIIKMKTREFKYLNIYKVIGEREVKSMMQRIRTH